MDRPPRSSASSNDSRVDRRSGWAFLSGAARFGHPERIGDSVISRRGVVGGVGIWSRRAASSTGSGDPPSLGRARRAPRTIDVQCLTEALGEAFLGDRAVPELAALVVDDDPDERAEPVEHALTLSRAERARRLHVEAELDACRRLVRVLTARATRRREPHLELAPRDPHRPRHRDHVVVHPTDRDTPALPYGARNG